MDALTEDMGTTVRFWKLSDLAAGPTAIAQLPIGPGREKHFQNNAPEGVMSVALPHLRRHKGVFAATMGGGTIWYAPDATAADPKFRMIYRVGPGAAAAVFTLTRTTAICCSRSRAPGRPATRSKIATIKASTRAGSWPWTFRGLLAAGDEVECAAPQVKTDADGHILLIPARNNGADDCPKVTGELNLDSQANFATHGGPHFVAFNHETRRVAVANYFVQLTPFNLPGTHEAGDDRICMARLTQSGELRLDRAFKDELTGRPCVSMDRPLSYLWPNYGRTGAAKPHAMAFIDVGDWQGD